MGKVGVANGTVVCWQAPVKMSMIRVTIRRVIDLYILLGFAEKDYGYQEVLHLIHRSNFLAIGCLPTSRRNGGAADSGCAAQPDTQ